jgi:predicted RNA-binding Zn-ribbon protein involved in translation (DUF1610 family)
MKVLENEVHYCTTCKKKLVFTQEDSYTPWAICSCGEEYFLRWSPHDGVKMVWVGKAVIHETA